MKNFKRIAFQLLVICVFFSCSIDSSNQLTSAKIEHFNGRIIYNINGKQYYPMMYSSPYGRPRKPSTATGKENYTNFTNAGIDLFEMSIYIRKAWNEDGTLDKNKVDEELIDNLEGIYAINPDSYFQVRIMLNAPDWWHEKYPEELVNFAGGPVDFNEGNEINKAPRASLASERWKTESSAILKQLLDYLQTKDIGNRIFSFMMCAGVYNEWHYYGFPHEPDTGEPMTRRFRQWLEKHYKTDEALQLAWGDNRITLATASVPDLSERKQNYAGVFRDPQKERKIIDYFTNQHEVVERDIFHFTKYIKEYWPSNVLVGIFNGYFFYHQGGFNTGGHLSFDKILENPYLDFIAAPYNYKDPARELGGTGQPRGITESVKLHGKLYMTEQDRSTHLPGAVTTGGFLRDEFESVANMRTSFSQMINHSTGYWFFDFGKIGWWNSPALMAEIYLQKSYCDKMLHQEYKSEADVAFIYDFNTFYYVAETENIQSDELQNASATWMCTDAYRSGIAFDTYLLNDLPLIDLDKYKVFVFGTTYLMSDEQIDFINTKIKRDGKTVIFTYAPAYTDGKTLDVNRISKVTGIDVGQISMDAPPEITLGTGNVNVGLAESGGPGEVPVSPLFEVKEKNVEVLGQYKGTNVCAIARKTEKDYTTVYSALPLRNPDFMRSLFKEAGAHIYSYNGDAVIAGGGVICVTTKRGKGGKRVVTLKNGKEVSLDLFPGASAIIDDKTGNIIFN